LNNILSNSFWLAVLVSVLSFSLTGPLLAEETRLVSVGEHNLEVSVQGSGDQTIVFESGLGYDYAVWGEVAARLSQSAKVVSYSRAGNGGSDKSDLPRTLERVATELNNLLVAEKLSPPFILVGHSAGGFYIRKYAELFPENVQGFVFVDATPEQILVRLSEIDRERMLKEEVVINAMMPDHVKPEDIYFSKITETGVYPATRKLPDVPAAMVTAMRREHPQFLFHSIEGKQAWRELHAEFISQFSDHLHIVSSVSGHNVHREQPDVVVGAIQYVMRQAAEPTTDEASGAPE